MKISKLFGPALMAVVLAFFVTGCASFRPPVSRPFTYALVVSVSTGQPPTEAQWTELQKKFATFLATRGYALVSDPALADRIIHVRYIPDLTNPDDATLGQAVVMSVRNNPPAVAANAYAATPSYASLNSVYNAFYESTNYFTPTNDVYIPGPRHAPPSHPITPPGSTKPGDCPPITFAGNYPVHIINPNPGDGHRTVHPSSGSGSGSGYSRADSSYSRSDSSYSRSDSSYSSSNGSSVSNSFTPASSYSSSSYSPPAPSSSDSSSSSVSSSFSPAASYSAPSYSPPAPSETRAQPN